MSNSRQYRHALLTEDLDQYPDLGLQVNLHISDFCKVHIFPGQSSY